MGKKNEIKSFGSLYFDGVPQSVGVKYSNEDFLIGDTVSELTIPWCRIGQKWIATKVVLFDILWRELATQGFICGKPIKIDGQYYLCRVLNGDTIGLGETEWDEALAATRTSNEFWHWESQFSWSNRLCEDEAGKERAYVYGGTNAKSVNSFLVSVRYGRIGFRPVLEPLPPLKAITKKAIGQYVQAYGPAGKVGGVLKDFSDYDLIIEGDLFDGTDDWMSTDGKMISVDKEQLVYWNIT